MKSNSLKWFKNQSFPNQLTASRIVLVPILIFLLSFDNRWTSLAACLLFILGALTDIIDGYLARKMDHVSQMGKLLDPLADKLMALCVLIMLMYLGRIHFLFVIMLIAREFAVNSLRGIATSEGVVISASPVAKYKTAAQSIALIGLILGKENALFGVQWFSMGEFFLIVAVFLSLYSGYQYFSYYRVGTMQAKSENHLPEG